MANAVPTPTVVRGKTKRSADNCCAASVAVYVEAVDENPSCRS
ncbi:Uncharacterised protein [Vibrio cholerae]|nr:Uncharacterised protein [Vibrio cholerae]